LKINKGKIIFIIKTPPAVRRVKESEILSLIVHKEHKTFF